MAHTDPSSIMAVPPTHARRDSISAITPSTVAADVPTARDLIAGAVYQTPHEGVTWLSEVTGARVSFKLECYQPTGSFKVRGAMTAVLNLTPEQRDRGVITASAGNHGLGLAYAATRAGVRATVVVPDTASSAKVHALRRFPINLIFGGPNYDDAERTALDMATSTGAHFLSPYNDPWVIAGQGTIGLELFESDAPPDVVLIPVGGGGLIGGIGSYLKSRRPETRIIGVQAANSPAMAEALRVGGITTIPIIPTLADGLAANIQPGARTYDLAREVVEEIVLIEEDEMKAAVRATFDELHLALEASAVVGIAALAEGKVHNITGKNVTAVITGRNIATERLLEILGE